MHLASISTIDQASYQSVDDLLDALNNFLKCRSLLAVKHVKTIPDQMAQSTLKVQTQRLYIDTCTGLNS